MPLLKSVRLPLLLILLAAVTVGCSGENYDPTAEWTAEDFYDEAIQSLNAGEFQTAIKHLETLEARFPFDPYAKQAQLDVAYSYYKFDEADTAISAVKRFIRLHPRDKHIDYALYLKGIINFNRGRGLLDKWFPHDHSRHDPSLMQQSFDDFAQLVRRFPDSYYAGDAHQRMIFLRNKMAEQELLAADFYIARGTWLSVANRAKAILEKYPQSIWRNDALKLMARAYRELGLDDLAADTDRILKLNSGDSHTSEDQRRAGKLDATLETPPSYIDALFKS